jgi:hypothetical protein
LGWNLHCPVQPWWQSVESCPWLSYTFRKGNCLVCEWMQHPVTCYILVEVRRLSRFWLLFGYAWAVFGAWATHCANLFGAGAIYQLDGTPSHFHRKVRLCLDMFPPDAWIG